MKAHEADDLQVAMQAAQWQATLNGATSRERDAFVSWLLESRRNVRNYLLLTAFEKELKNIDAERKHDVEDLLCESAPLPLTRPRWSAGTLSHKGRGVGHIKRMMAIAVAASVAALAVWWSAALRDPSYTTAVGEQRSISLPDGSLIQLNTRSEVRTQFTDRTRTVRLLEGEALFTVRPDPARPFRVDVGDSVIQALGTQFNVYRSVAGTMVSVVEGVVELQPSGARLRAGEQASILRGNKLARTPTADIPAALAWQDRRLIFRSDRLEDIAAEFNRYNSAHRIRVEGDAVRDRRITGIFAADDPELLVRFLAQDADLSVARDDQNIVIRQR